MTIPATPLKINGWHLKLKRKKIFWPKPLWLWVPNVNLPGCKRSNDDPNANPPPSGIEAYFMRITENPLFFGAFSEGTWTDSKIQRLSTRTKLTQSAPLTCYRLASSDFFRHGGGNIPMTGLNIPRVTVCPSKDGAWENTFLLGRLIFIGHVCFRLSFSLKLTADITAENSGNRTKRNFIWTNHQLAGLLLSERVPLKKKNLLSQADYELVVFPPNLTSKKMLRQNMVVLKLSQIVERFPKKNLWKHHVYKVGPYYIQMELFQPYS